VIEEAEEVAAVAEVASEEATEVASEEVTEVVAPLTTNKEEEEERNSNTTKMLSPLCEELSPI